MKAEVTAENRPACDASDHVRTWRIHGTHEDEGGVQVFVILLHELLVVLLSLLAVVLVESKPILLTGR